MPTSMCRGWTRDVPEVMGWTRDRMGYTRGGTGIGYAWDPQWRDKGCEWHVHGMGTGKSDFQFFLRRVNRAPQNWGEGFGIDRTINPLLWTLALMAPNYFYALKMAGNGQAMDGQWIDSSSTMQWTFRVVRPRWSALPGMGGARDRVACLGWDSINGEVLSDAFRCILLLSDYDTEWARKPPGVGRSSAGQVHRLLRTKKKRGARV